MSGLWNKLHIDISGLTVFLDTGEALPSTELFCLLRSVVLCLMLKEPVVLQGKTATKMIHAPDSGSEFSRRSSLNSEEKFLFDELQNELMTLKRAMRSKEEDASKKVNFILY